MIVLSKYTDKGTLYWKAYPSIRNPKVLLISTGFVGGNITHQAINCIDEMDVLIELEDRVIQMRKKGYTE